jgi:hypothetical protein
MRALVGAAMVLPLALPPATQAQMVGRCLPHDDAIANLAKQHEEQQIGVGVAQNGRMLYELFIAEDGRTWTVLATRPNGISCVAAEGTGWMSIPFVSGAPL